MFNPMKWPWRHRVLSQVLIFLPKKRKGSITSLWLREWAQTVTSPGMTCTICKGICIKLWWSNWLTNTRKWGVKVSCIPESLSRPRTSKTAREISYAKILIRWKPILDLGQIRVQMPQRKVIMTLKPWIPPQVTWRRRLMPIMTPNKWAEILLARKLPPWTQPKTAKARTLWLTKACFFKILKHQFNSTRLSTKWNSAAN